jgi:hypothetical protein
MASVNPEVIAELRRQQQAGRASLGFKAPAPAAPVNALERALASVALRESESQESGGYIYNNKLGFRYPAETERRRWARTREVLSRVSPGPDEDGDYLALLARQAASIEMALCSQYSKAIPRAAEICDRVLLATVPSTGSDAYSRAYRDYYFVLVESGLIDFLRQLSNAAILSWRPITPTIDPAHPRPANALQYSFKREPEDLDTVLNADPYPLQLLQRSLSAYIFEGQPRIDIRPLPSQAYQMPLAALMDMSERFVIAHEYGHTLHDELAAADAGGAWQEEFFADTAALRLAVGSGFSLDRLPAPYAMFGGFFLPMALDILRRTLNVIRYGKVQPDAGFASHPPLAVRWLNLRRLYLEEISDKHDENSVYAAQSPSSTLEYLWSRLMKEGVPEWRSGRAPHAMWNAM